MLTLGGKPLQVPILQGGMGVGVSLGGLAGAVAACGGMGCISTADAGYREPDFARDPAAANHRALTAEIQKAKAIAEGMGLVAINAMVATRDYADAIRTAVAAGVDAVVSGAGLPLELPGIVGTKEVAIAPIVSSARAAKLILRRWAKGFDRTADFMVIEGCKAGGHLGFAEEDLLADRCQTLDEILPGVLAEVKPYEEQYGHAIPVFVAGGVYTGADMAHFTKLGAAGVQLATRFIPTYECDASQTYKDVLLAAKPEDVRIIHSPVGMPGRALNTPLGQALPAQALRPVSQDLRPRRCALLHHPRPHRGGEGQRGGRTFLLRRKRGQAGPDAHRARADGRTCDRMEAELMKLAVLYAGQGVQHPGMGKEFYEASPAFRAAFDSAALDFDLHRVCFEDPDGVLNQTEYTQPCMVAFACGVTAVLAEKGVKPAYLAGLSLGEYSALQAAGVFTAKQAIELTAFRGKAMAEAAKGLDCGMTAVLGLDREKLSACCEQAAETGCVQICNYNCPGQLVIGGEKAAVEKAAELAKAAGARRCIPLKVSGPFHTKLMAPAGDALAQRFAGENFGTMETPVLFNCLGHEKAETDSIPQLLVKQVQSSVYMEDTLRRLGELGVDHILEVGPGNALSGFVKKTLPGVVCTAVETPEQLDAVLTAWKDAE